MGKDNFVFRAIRRLTGLNQANIPSFYDRESFDQERFNEITTHVTGLRPKNTAIEDFIGTRVIDHLSEVKSSYSDAENFLLLINSAALAGIFALFDQLDLSGYTRFHILTVLMFFLSLMFLGLSKWSRIVHSNYLSGEFYKNTIRFYAGQLSAFDLVVAEYRSRGVRSVRGLWAILSFISFGLGWAFLYLIVTEAKFDSEEPKGLFVILERLMHALFS